MKHRRSGLALASLLLFCTATAFAEDDAPAPDGARPRAGTLPVPADKPYDQLTAEQKAVVKAGYPAMAAADEPPYPAAGRQALDRDLFEAARDTRAHDGLEVAAVVDADGVARHVDVVHASRNRDFMRAVTRVLLRTTWKPAVCGGQPCAMSFPVKVDAVRHE